MTNIAIRVENLSKRYRIGVRQKRANTLRERLANLAASPFDYLRSTLRGPSLHSPFSPSRRRAAPRLRRELSRTMHGRVGSLLEVGTGFHPTPLSPRKQGEGRAGEHLPERGHV